MQNLTFSSDAHFQYHFVPWSRTDPEGGGGSGDDDQAFNSATQFELVDGEGWEGDPPGAKCGGQSCKVFRRKQQQGGVGGGGELLLRVRKEAEREREKEREREREREKERERND